MLPSLIPLVAQQPGGGGSAVGTILPLLLMVGIFYFLLIRPQQRRQRQQRELVQSVAVGDEVLTVGGIYGRVRSVDDAEVTLEVADGVEIRLLKSAIARRLTESDLGDIAEEGAGDQT